MAPLPVDNANIAQMNLLHCLKYEMFTAPVCGNIGEMNENVSNKDKLHLI